MRGNRVLRRQVPARVEQGQRGGLEQHDELRDYQEAALVDLVGQRACGQREEQDGDAAHEVHHARIELAVAQAVDHDRQRVVLHPAAGVGDEGAGPEQAEIAEAERLERAPAPDNVTGGFGDVGLELFDLVGTVGHGTPCRWRG